MDLEVILEISGKENQLPYQPSLEAMFSKVLIDLNTVDEQNVIGVVFNGVVYSCQTTYKTFNRFARYILSDCRPEHVEAFLQVYGASNLCKIENMAFYADAEDYLFSELEGNDRVCQAKNGIIIEDFD